MDKDVEKIIANEQEWRRHILKKLDAIEQDLINLRIKNAAIASFVGFVSSMIATYIRKL